ncbi:hypothetical protein GCM10009551_079380 [Nocardiopsis tropica]|nr:hypothetical protein TTY48_29940 [Tsukamurella sp. TY48]
MPWKKGPSSNASLIDPGYLRGRLTGPEERVRRPPAAAIPSSLRLVAADRIIGGENGGIRS